MSWSPQQEAAIRKAEAWMRDKKGSQIHRIFGYAGTGKTTMAKHLATMAGGPVEYACFTGKAAQVLRTKGCDGASTIHSLIYKAEKNERTGEVKFKLNRDSRAAYASLIIIDEVSMVGEDLAKDLLSFGKKVLVLGDPAQLPPVKGEGYFISAEPDSMLTEIHRQAQENPIIRASMDIRDGRLLQPGAYGEECQIVARDDVSRERLRELVLGADQVLCGLNKTRHTYNQGIRRIKGLQVYSQPWLPVTGDRLVCLRNDREKSLFNGGLWEAEKVDHTGELVMMRVTSLDEPDRMPVDVETQEHFFKGTEASLDWRKKVGFQEFTFGWTLTVHKSQGSQWNNVLLFDESRSFRDNSRQWLYTGLTRAAERITIVN